jgi:RND family efflux transporter MFP subunit
LTGARARLFALLFGAVGTLFLIGYLPRHIARAKLVARTAAEQQTPPRVGVTKAVAIDKPGSLSLPGNLVADRETFVYARANGYVRRWLVDIGDQVNTGDLLAELETPELNQQLAQARANVRQRQAALWQAQSNRAYAQQTAIRMHALRAQKFISQQDDDQARSLAAVGDANVMAAESDLKAAQASVLQLEQMVSFGRVMAPFDGTITQRLVEVGSLVAAGGGAPSQALFQIQATDPMRVFVQIPQTYAPSVRMGQDAEVSVRQYPGRVFHGHVSRTAGALDPSSRTLNTEIDVPNETGQLIAGMYAQVLFTLSVAHRIVQVPTSAVVADARGVYVAVVNDAGVVHLAAVLPGPDNGSTVELVKGLSGDEQVIVSPPADVIDGMRIESMPVAPPKQDGG